MTACSAGQGRTGQGRAGQGKLGGYQKKTAQAVQQATCRRCFIKLGAASLMVEVAVTS